MQDRYAEMPAGGVGPVQVEELGHYVRPGQDDDLLAVAVLDGRNQRVDRPVAGQMPPSAVCRGRGSRCTLRPLQPLASESIAF